MLLSPKRYRIQTIDVFSSLGTAWICPGVRLMCRSRFFRIRSLFRGFVQDNRFERLTFGKPVYHDGKSNTLFIMLPILHSHQEDPEIQPPCAFVPSKPWVSFMHDILLEDVWKQPSSPSFPG